MWKQSILKGMAMANDSLVKRIFSLSPHIEMIVRRLYWRNVWCLSKRVKKTKPVEFHTTSIDYNKIEKFLFANGVAKGELIVVHSSYAPLKGRGKTANQIIDMLCDFVGSQGTVAMPAMPKFKNAVDVKDYLTKDYSNILFEYNVQKTSVKTGVLPLMLHKRETSMRSRHPINSMVAMGPLSESIMENNLSDNSSLACGEDSSWKSCLDNDAIIIGLGTDLTHSLTMIHVAEDVLNEKWPVKNWYIEKNFLVKDDDFEEKYTLRERAPHWGALHFAERTLCKDLINIGILKTTVIDGVIVEIIKSKELIDFLIEKNSNGYPYFWLNK